MLLSRRAPTMAISSSLWVDYILSWTVQQLWCGPDIVPCWQGCPMWIQVHMYLHLGFCLCTMCKRLLRSSWYFNVFTWSCRIYFTMQCSVFTCKYLNVIHSAKFTWYCNALHCNVKQLWCGLGLGGGGCCWWPRCDKSRSGVRWQNSTDALALLYKYNFKCKY